MDFYGGFTVGFAQHWKFSAEYVQFNFPNSIPTAYNGVFTLSYSDAHWGWWIPLNPYVSLFYNFDGGSTVVLGKTSDAYRVTVGIVPTVDLFKGAFVPVTVAFPTSVTFGPEEFWNRNDGTTNRCGRNRDHGLRTQQPCILHHRHRGEVLACEHRPEAPRQLVRQGRPPATTRSTTRLCLPLRSLPSAATSFANAKDDVFVGSGSIGFTF